MLAVRQSARKADMLAVRQADSKSDKQTDRQASRQTQANIMTNIILNVQPDGYTNAVQLIRINMHIYKI
jgi:hypothetical protein